MMMQRLLSILLATSKFFIYYIAAPGMAWTLSLLGGLDWISRTSEVDQSLFGGLVLLLLVAAFAYQTGYRGSYRSGRKRYFLMVFIAPIIVGAIGLLVGFLTAH
jgi:hypothetical protein